MVVVRGRRTNKKDKKQITDTSSTYIFPLFVVIRGYNVQPGKFVSSLVPFTGKTASKYYGVLFVVFLEKNDSISAGLFGRRGRTEPPGWDDEGLSRVVVVVE